MGRTREQQREYDKKYMAANRERVLARKRLYHIVHKAKEAQKKKEYRLRQRAKIAEYNQQYHVQHQEEIDARHREYNRRHRAKLLEYNKKYVSAHRQVYYAHAKTRRALRAGSPINDLTLEQWDQLKDEVGYRCFYCGEIFSSLTQDHIVPLSRGGPHTLNNVVAACQSCNSSKNSKTLEEYYYPLWASWRLEG